MITFSYPIVTPTLTLQLRSPDLNDSVIHDNRVTFVRLMNDTVRSYVSSPRNKKLVLSFRLITKAKLDEINTFIKNTLGYEIKLVDWRSRTWHGYIISDPLEYRCIADDNYTLTLEYQGILQ